MREIKTTIDGLEIEKKNLLKQMHATCHTVEDVQSEIKDLERRLTTTSMSGQQETKTIKEIDQLKASVPLAKRFSEIDPELKELKAQKKKIWNEIAAIRSKEDELNGEMELIKKDLELTNAEKDENRAQQDAIQAKIEKVDEELTALYKTKDEKREAFWEGKYNFKK